MARFSESFINSVLQATDIAELVGQHVALKQRGREFVGLCPFHDDHNPSMCVVPAKQMFYCFVCHAGGSALAFLMKLHKIEFPEAVRELAQRAGIPLPVEAEQAGEDRSLASDTLIKLNTFAARFYRDRLFSPDGQAALDYARARRISDESIRRFGLGFAPDGGQALRMTALRQGFTDRQLLAAGLVAQREDGGCYDRFRHRLMFPIFDVSGRIIAFGGRALAPDAPAKYLNSPQTVLFDKSANLYGLNFSREAIGQAGQVIVVEGYLDALMPMQEGVENVVATLGTALTERHVRLLSRHAKEVVLVFDGDAAGQAATERAIELFLSQRLQVRVAMVPGEANGQKVKDPCDLVLAAGGEALRELVRQSPDALAHAWNRRRDLYLATPTLAGKRAIVEDFLRLIVSSATYGAIDALRQGLLSQHLGELVGLSPQAIADQLRQIARTITRASGPAATATPAASLSPAGPADRAERWCLGALLNDPGLFELVRDRLSPEMFANAALRAVAQHLWRLGVQQRLDLPALLGLEEMAQHAALAVDLQVDGERRGAFERTLMESADDILRRRQQEQMELLRQTDKDAHAQAVVEQARRPDARRRPRIG